MPHCPLPRLIMRSPLVILSLLLLTFLSLSSVVVSQEAVDTAFLTSSIDSLLTPSPSPVESVEVDALGSTTFTAETDIAVWNFPHPAFASKNTAKAIPAPSNVSSHTFQTKQTERAVFAMERMTERAPWSGRIQPALLYQKEPVLYRNWQTNVQVSTGDHWLLMYEGSLSRLTADTETTNENDVWASMDDGVTWDLISGISRYGASGVVYSRTPNSSFTPRGGSANCEDPASDRIYSVAGYRYNISNGVNRGMVGSTQVFTSLDGKTWNQFGGPQTWPQPNRYFSSCDVDINGHVYTMGASPSQPMELSLSSTTSGPLHKGAGRAFPLPPGLLVRSI